MTHLPATIKEAVIQRFGITSPLVGIARCESQFRQYAKDGSVLHGKAHYPDIGVMQINAAVHIETAKKLGLDLYSLEGNMDYADYLYKKLGTQPWKSSKACWAVASTNKSPHNS